LQIFATFEHTLFLELVISQLKEKGITDIFAVPLDNRTEERRLFDTLHNSDGVSMIGKGTALAVLFSVVGASRGFMLQWGPIYWGLIGAAVGFILGFLIDLYIQLVYKKRKRVLKGKNSEVILIINCEENQDDYIESILWEHLALGLAKIK
jgi:UDP-N-acetylmuramyl pentapeptide phosphotransferase/UDP-N-acetylglucosamine-1-phosphate transferase